jgi:pimeloyl-ACP methyl ester carboxylesterase
LVLSRPELVAKLVLAAGDSGGPNVIPITEEAYEALTEREGRPSELLERAIGASVAPGFVDAAPDVIEELVAYRLSGAVPAEAYQAQVAAGIAMVAPESSFESRLDQIQVPTLILAGEHDQVVPPGNAELLAARIPGAQVRILPGVGHLLPIEDPEATASALTEFFGGRKYG